MPPEWFTGLAGSDEKTSADNASTKSGHRVLCIRSGDRAKMAHHTFPLACAA